MSSIPLIIKTAAFSTNCLFLIIITSLSDLDIPLFDRITMPPPTNRPLSEVISGRASTLQMPGPSATIPTPSGPTGFSFINVAIFRI